MPRQREETSARRARSSLYIYMRTCAPCQTLTVQEREAILAEIQQLCRLESEWDSGEGEFCLSAQYPFKDVIAQRGLCGQGRASHAVVGVRAAQGDPTAALHIWSVGGKHGKAKAVPEAGVELPTFELESSGEWESIPPGGGRAAGAAEESGPGALAILGAEGKGGQQGVCSGLGGVPGECALLLRNDAHGDWAGLAVLPR
jgi:hypothetical protein